jgi:hypothetical protein
MASHLFQLILEMLLGAIKPPPSQPSPILNPKNGGKRVPKPREEWLNRFYSSPIFEFENGGG